MKAAFAAGLALISPLMKAETPIDRERLMEAICQIEGSEWKKPGGRACIHYAAWSQHSELPYQGSMTKETAWPVYLAHLEWLIYNLRRNKIAVTASSVNVCWHHGLQGGIAILRKHPHPDEGTRCQNLYESLSAPPPPKPSPAG